MFDSDTRILNALKKSDNPLISKFHLTYPDKGVATSNNVIYVGALDLENNIQGYDFQQYRSLVEVSIVLKQTDYAKAMRIIKTTVREILKILEEEGLRTQTNVRNIHFNYDVNKDYTILKGASILLQLNEMEAFNIPEEEFDKVCEILLEEVDII